MLPFLTKAELDWKFRHHCGEDKEFYEQAMNTIEASWNCRECIILSDEDYFKKQEMLNTQKIQ